MKRLMIVADHSLVAQTIRLAVRQTAGFEVLGFVDGRSPIVSVVSEAAPDTIVVDDMQEPDSALARVRELKAIYPDAMLLMLSLRMDPEWHDSAFDAGADAVVSKAVHPASLGTLLREVARGAVVNRPRPTRSREATEDCPLTSRELEILRLVAQGYTNGRIARELWVTEQTVKFHLSNTYRKLGVANRTEASRYAHMNDLAAAA